MQVGLIEQEDADVHRLGMHADVDDRVHHPVHLNGLLGREAHGEIEEDVRHHSSLRLLGQEPPSHPGSTPVGTDQNATGLGRAVLEVCGHAVGREFDVGDGLAEL